MEWLKTILPLLGVCLGWYLAERGKLITEGRLDKRKLKKLLFFLLELRYHFYREFSIEIDLYQHLKVLLTKISGKIGVDLNEENFKFNIDTYKPFLEKSILKEKTSDSKLEYLSQNIDEILMDLAEVFPILAYELNGRHNIQERLKKANNHFIEMESMIGKSPFDLARWLNPPLTKELLKDLDKSIKQVALKIDKKHLKNAEEKIKKMESVETDIEVDNLIDELLKLPVSEG